LERAHDEAKGAEHSICSGRLSSAILGTGTLLRRPLYAIISFWMPGRARRTSVRRSILRAGRQSGSGRWGAPNFTTSLRFLEACYAHMGRFDVAREIARRLGTITPLVMEPATRYRNLELRELFLSSLRIATNEAG
jgi:hypothetical protein